MNSSKLLFSSFKNNFKIINVVSDLMHHVVKSYSMRSVSNIVLGVIHHSASVLSSLDQIVDYHVNGHDWPGIGYHYVIDKNGSCYQTQPLNTVSYHCKGQNTRSIGICLLGNFEKEKPTFKQLAALYLLMLDIKYKLPNIKYYPHYTFRNTLCPGKNFMPSFADFLMNIIL